MRVVNEKLETITYYDLETGYLIPAQVIREDAAPIDGQTKLVWAEEDYEEAQMYLPKLGGGTVTTEITAEELTLELLADHEYRLCMLELGEEETV